LRSVSHGPEAERKFFSDWRWLFASQRDLLLIECEIRRERERSSPFDLGLEQDPCEEEVDDSLVAWGEAKKEQSGEATDSQENADPFVVDPNDKPLERLRKRIEHERKRHDRYPTGYFRNESGTLYALVLKSPTKGMGGFSADALFDRVKAEVARVNARRFHPKAVVGYAGDILSRSVSPST
jgi:hypothetical protein